MLGHCFAFKTPKFWTPRAIHLPQKSLVIVLALWNKGFQLALSGYHWWAIGNLIGIYIVYSICLAHLYLCMNVNTQWIVINICS